MKMLRKVYGIFAAVVIGISFIASAPMSAATQVRDNDGNAIIYGGAYSVSELKRKLDNGTGKPHQSGKQLTDLFAKNGVYEKDFGQLVDGYVTDDNKVIVGGKVVKTNVTTMGRHNIKGSTKDKRFSYPIYLRHPNVSFLSKKLPAFVSMNYDGSYAYAILKPCGNIVKGPGVKVKPAPKKPACKIVASPTEIVVGDSSTLTYSSTNATSASISVIGKVSLSGKKNVTPTKTTKYTLTVKGKGGTATCDDTVVVKPKVVEEAPKPVCSILATPASIEKGTSSVLAYSTENATSASIGSIGSVSVGAGQKTVAPSSTKKYTMTVAGKSGTATCSTTVSVTEKPIVYPVPACKISVSSANILEGESTTLAYSSTNAKTASITHIGGVALAGTKKVTPKESTEYQMTVVGKGGTAICDVEVVVNDKPVEPEVPKDPTPEKPVPVVIQEQTQKQNQTVYVSQASGKGNMPASGPVEAAAGAVGLTSTGGAALAWIRSKKNLLSAIIKIK